MTMVRFATTCDGAHLELRPGVDAPEWRMVTCGKRSQEYDSWPACEDCGAHFCPDCQEPGTKTDADVDTPERCVCKACWADRGMGL